MEFLENHFKEIATFVIAIICVLGLIFLDKKQKKKIKYLKEIILLCLGFLLASI
ncbi:hypothetical protein [Polaribacter reichenbachii]|uniref:hypothetical protein n=1 Tax=Polaribacter reichenbachii TaxID=996801 RepID=UPI0012FA20CF|nr:hypothetical protein [Polaribacter reichenbachii]